jgi:hypothetical protein
LYLFIFLFYIGFNIKPAGFEYPSSYSLPDSKEEVGDGTVSNEFSYAANNYINHNPLIAYPNTDNQYINATSNTNNTNELTQQNNGSLNTSEEYNSTINPLSNIINNNNNNNEEDDDDITAWSKHQDPNSNAIYYYNSDTGKSSFYPPVTKK